jgi:LuxR family maltose regulon positive regulatory protein
MVAMEMSPFPISKTKIIVPRRRPEIVVRARLIDALYDLLDRKLTLISAAAGSGKSSLLIDFADQSEVPICWLSLDELDQEPQRFLSYFVACINEHFPDFGKESFAAIRNISSVDKDIEKLVIAFTNEIHQNIPEHFAIVLDDYHFVDLITEVRLFINRFIQLAGENCHLILASRTLPSLPDLHLLAARDQVGGISFEDLAFLPEEIQTFFSQNSGEMLSVEDANKLAKETEGWVTSLTLSSLSHIGVKAQKDSTKAGTGVEVFDYFAREILEKQPEDIQRFLLLTSLLDEIEIDLVDEVLVPLLGEHSQNWKLLFKTVQKSNLFVIPLGTDGKSFRYHHLFQAFLQTQLQTKDPTLVHEVMSRLAQNYVKQQEWEKAHFIYETIDDQDALIKIIEQASTYFIRNGRIATLGNWLERLPVKLIKQNAELLSLQGYIAFTQGQTQLGISLLSDAEKVFRKNGDSENLASTLVRRAVIYRDMGEYTLALSDAEEAFNMGEKHRTSRLEDILAVAQREKGLALYRLGRTKEAISWLENSLHLFTLLKEQNAIPILEMELGMAYQALGNNNLAVKFYNNALKVWERTGNLVWQATLRNNLGVLLHSQGDYVQAFASLENALDCARRSNNVRAEALALCSLGDLLTDIQELNRANDCFAQALNLAFQLKDAYLGSYASISIARIARLTGNFPLAEKQLLDLLPRLRDNTFSSEDTLFYQEYGCLLLFSGNLVESLNKFRQAVDLCKQDGRIHEECVGRLWLACALIAAGQDDAAASQLNDFYFISKDLKDLAFLYVNLGQMLFWIEKINLQDDVKSFIRQITGKAERFSKSIPALRRKLRQLSYIVSISPPHLIIKAFGPGQVFYNGNLITLSDWQTRETRDLFFFFLHSKPLTKEEIASIFWPDISPSRLKMRFKTSIYRLRHAVGQETILFEDERYKFNRGIDYDYDVENFQQLVSQADQAKNPTEITSLLKAVVDMAKESYLVDIDADWVYPERVQIKALYQATIMRLAGLCLEQGQAEKTLEVCRIALETDALIEEAYRLSMRAYAVLGDRAAIVRQFQACSDTFEEELGVKPSKETEKLYKQLI